MRTKELTIICITIILVVLLVCGSIVYITLTNEDNSSRDNQTNNDSNVTVSPSPTTKSSSSSQQSNTNSVDTDEDGYIDGKKINYRNEKFLGEDSDLEQFSTSDDLYIKQKSTGKIAKRHLDDDGAYRYYDTQTGKCVLG